MHDSQSNAYTLSTIYTRMTHNRRYTHQSQCTYIVHNLHIHDSQSNIHISITMYIHCSQSTHTCITIEYTYINHNVHMHESRSNIHILYTYSTWWPRPIGCLKLQVISRKRVTNYRAHLRNMTYKDKASYGSSPPCNHNLLKRSA